MPKDSTESRAGTVVRLPPTPAIRLKTIDDIRVELARVYREGRRGELDLSAASKLAFILGQLVRVAELALIENRLNELERVVEDEQSNRAA